MPRRYPEEISPACDRAGPKRRQTGHPHRGGSRLASSCLRRWMKQDDIEGGRREGLNSDERAELVCLRRELRTAKLENEILRRPAAYFAKETLRDPK
jgi:hypothetical protein